MQRKLASFIKRPTSSEPRRKIANRAARIPGACIYRRTRTRRVALEKPVWPVRSRRAYTSRRGASRPLRHGALCGDDVNPRGEASPDLKTLTLAPAAPARSGARLFLPAPLAPGSARKKGRPHLFLPCHVLCGAFPGTRWPGTCHSAARCAHTMRAD